MIGWIVGGLALLFVGFVCLAGYFYHGLAKATREHRARNGGMM